MKIIIECPEIAISSLVEAVQNKVNEYAEHGKQTEWFYLKKFYKSQEQELYNVLMQIAKQINEGGKENDS